MFITNVVYRRKIFDMSHRRNRVLNSGNNSDEARQSEQDNNLALDSSTIDFLDRIEQIVDRQINRNLDSRITSIKKKIVVTIIAGLCTVAGFIWVLSEKNSEFEAMQENLNSIVDDMGEVRRSVMTLSATVDNMSSQLNRLESDMSTMDERIIYLYAANGLPLNVYLASKPETSLVEYSAAGKFSVEDPSWKDSDFVSVDPETGDKLSMSDLVGKTILTSYEDAGSQIIFEGQYNKNLHWDGKCLINVYKNDELQLITEAVYDDGRLTSYDQAFPDTASDGTDIWVYTERYYSDNLSIGDTFRYFRDINCTKDFALADIEVSDILTLRGFKENYCKRLEGFYHGNVSNGMYNDETGNAYFVKYDKDGNILTFYVGRFKNGMFNDMTGTAWYITDNESTEYMYYRGNFRDGKKASDKGYVFKNNLRIDDITELVNESLYVCDFQWGPDAYLD